MAGNFGGEYLVDKLFERMRHRKKQKGGRVGLVEGVKKLDSAIQTAYRLALATLLGGLVTGGGYKAYKNRINRQKGGRRRC